MWVGTLNGAYRWAASITVNGLEVQAFIQWTDTRWEIGLPSPINMLFSYNLSGSSPTLIGGCSVVSPPAGVTNLTISGFSFADANGEYEWIGTENGSNLWLKNITAGNFINKAIIRKSAGQWVMMSSSGSIESGFNFATNSSCSESVPCTGWGGSPDIGNPYISGGCSGGTVTNPAGPLPAFIS